MEFCLPSLEGEHWKTYHSGYNRILYDPRPLIARLQSAGTSEAFWEEVWDELHHQGDVGEASYALVPFLAGYALQAQAPDAQLLVFITVVELARRNEGNPPLPPELAESYHAAISLLPKVIGRYEHGALPEELVVSAAAALALANGHRLLAQAYLDFDTSEAKHFLAQRIGEDFE